MAANAAKLTRDAIDAVKAAFPSITVSSSSTSTRIYKALNPVAIGVAPVLADTERILYSLTYLAAMGKHLDNVLRDINVVRLRGETDDSLRRNAYKIFIPNSAVATEIDPDEVADENEQVDDIEIPTRAQLYGRMRARFAELAGLSDLPQMWPQVWAGTAQRLAELAAFMDSIIGNYVTDDAEDIADTKWCYEFSALRQPGALAAAAYPSEYNEVTIRVIVDDRPGRDARNRRVVFNPSEVLVAASEIAKHYLPQPDQRTLQAPALRVKPAVVRTFLVRATVGGGAFAMADVEQAIEDYVYAFRAFGGGVSASGMVQSALAVPGVSAFILGAPGPGDLEVGEHETVGIGGMDLKKA